MIVDFSTMLNYVLGFMCIIGGLYIYFKPREVAKRFGIKLTNNPNKTKPDEMMEDSGKFKGDDK